MMNSTIKPANYVLGIDGGGTKTIARLQHIKTHQQWQASGGASSLTNDYDLALNTCKVLIEELLTLSGVNKADISIVLGLAGAGNADKAKQFTKSLSEGFYCFELCTDAKTSLFGANSGEPVAVVSLGTGSVGATLAFDGHSTLKGGWGFTVGDDGSGAKLGVLIIKTLLAEIEENNCVISELGKAVCREIPGGKDKIIDWSTIAKPVDFARLAPLVFEFADTCPVAKNILSQHVKNVEKLIYDTRESQQLPVVLLGGLSMPTKPYLDPLIQQMLIPPKGDALDGACFLAKQLLNSEIKKEFTL
ncbi:BadF/BadG/BcrA/BcrD ATPase family protein [Thalassotalea profundi]|uniref:N-acetylglucosamine kinase n=1 Tax=Thalassotalea profundi TaxID=2036687 RepID=A0ABQ3IYP1_9GAMM|nr:BadF/BadG/BcrA/BcrD ATPase family protein [Thalassotalea profundi]GHE98643.1 N-acetylglucosamine kinase [Thalassotalea profundi]